MNCLERGHLDGVRARSDEDISHGSLFVRNLDGCRVTTQLDNPPFSAKEKCGQHICGNTARSNNDKGGFNEAKVKDNLPLEMGERRGARDLKGLGMRGLEHSFI